MMDFNEYKPYLSPALAKSTDLVAVSAKGCYLTDQTGKVYLDFVQGIAVNALGHCHPRIVKAISDQASKLINGSFNMVNFPSTLELAKRIAELAPGNLGSTFFSNGGAEATDGALKLARAYTKKPAIIAFKGSFHGRTIGATTVTGSNSKYRKYYEPLMGGVYFVPYPSARLCPAGMDEEQRSDYCLQQLQETFDYLVAPECVAAVIIEPVMGEGGYVVPPTRFLKKLREICTKNNILLIFDEIQCGYGRTGKMFASENFGVVPDIMTLGKAIAGGLPMSAVVSTPEIMAEWHAGMHGTTFGGNPVCAAAAVEVLNVFEEEHILENVAVQGEYLYRRLKELQAQYPVIGDVRGLGLMRAVEFVKPDGSPNGEALSKVRDFCFDHGMLTLSCGVYGNGMRFATPLNVKPEEIDQGMEILGSALASL